MEQTFDVGPLNVTVTDGDVCYAFADPMAIMLEIPPTFEEQLRDIATDRRAEFEGKSIYIDLADLPAISSRQLGMILTIREVMKPFGKLQLRGVSNSIRHFLKMTGTDRLFDIQG